MESSDGETQNPRSEVARSTSDTEDPTAAPAVSGSAREHRAVGKGCRAAQQTVTANAPQAARP